MAEKFMLADGFEDALLGVGWQFNKRIAVYDYAKCIDILIERDGMDYYRALEFFHANIIDVLVGPGSPVFLAMEKTHDKTD